ncbi:restriction endonuclease [Pectobacterium sp. A535-S3-A17]|uniref:restriction endonuclease n=1 Tax=Pectobacterium quasiaquaticum TaxID=2774015 RepID=UPI0018739056|nr:restriction endonuclease [Pectobacterium quasiaquaticum]MBE5215218.1 restriction endonuclease [Pectobacterium quasiaquaticum]MBE5225112.1 restriction endonuclease [Pectobacterium quasiaquaticum]
MTVPTYDKFIEPVLRFLATKPEGVPARDAHEAAANMLGLDDNQRAVMIASGQLVYKNRTGWAHDRLKRAGLSQRLSRGKWCLTTEGLHWILAHPQPLTEEEVNHLAFDFMDVKLKQQSDAVALDRSPAPPTNEELAKSSPDDRLDQALKELRDAVAVEVLENLLQVSPARFEVIVLDVLHRLGYGGHRDDLQRVGGTGDGGIDGIISLDKLGLEKVYVQAKRWQSTVGRPELQAFYGALAGQKAKRGVFITTSGFTAQARDFAHSVEGMVLVDGERLVHLMIENEVGVSSRLVKVPKLDMDYFE